MYYYNFQNFQKFGELRIGIDVFKIKKRHQALKEKNSQCIPRKPYKGNKRRAMLHFEGRTRGVSHFGLAIYTKKYLNAKEEL